MKTLIALVSSLLAVAAFPQDISVVRPNHYLQPGTFGNDQHLLPQSFFTPGKQVEDDLKSLRLTASASQQQPNTIPYQQQKQEQEQTQVQTQAASGEGSAASTESNAPDSYTNIGGSSGKVSSVLTNIHEYGEQVPKAFSNLEQDSYAFYHGKSQTK